MWSSSFPFLFGFELVFYLYLCFFFYSFNFDFSGPNICFIEGIVVFKPMHSLDFWDFAMGLLGEGDFDREDTVFLPLLL